MICAPYFPLASNGALASSRPHGPVVGRVLEHKLKLKVLVVAELPPTHKREASLHILCVAASRPQYKNQPAIHRDAVAMAGIKNPDNLGHLLPDRNRAVGALGVEGWTCKRRATVCCVGENRGPLVAHRRNGPNAPRALLDRSKGAFSRSSLGPPAGQQASNRFQNSCGSPGVADIIEMQAQRPQRIDLWERGKPHR